MAFRKFAVAAASAIVIMSLSAAVFAQSNQIQQAMRYCRQDMERLCPGVPPGGGRIVRCLKAHKMEMSVGCAMTLRRIKARMGG
jgi:Cysteine rich repeat